MAQKNTIPADETSGSNGGNQPTHIDAILTSPMRTQGTLHGYGGHTRGKQTHPPADPAPNPASGFTQPRGRLYEPSPRRVFKAASTTGPFRKVAQAAAANRGLPNKCSQTARHKTPLAESPKQKFRVPRPWVGNGQRGTEQRSGETERQGGSKPSDDG